MQAVFLSMHSNTEKGKRLRAEFSLLSCCTTEMEKKLIDEVVTGDRNIPLNVKSTLLSDADDLDDCDYGFQTSGFLFEIRAAANSAKRQLERQQQQQQYNFNLNVRRQYQQQQQQQTTEKQHNVAGIYFIICFQMVNILTTRTHVTIQDSLREFVSIAIEHGYSLRAFFYMIDVIRIMSTLLQCIVDLLHGSIPSSS